MGEESAARGGGEREWVKYRPLAEGGLGGNDGMAGQDADDVSS